MSDYQNHEGYTRYPGEVEQAIGKLLIANRDTINITGLGFADRMQLEALLHEHSMGYAQRGIVETRDALDIPETGVV